MGSSGDDSVHRDVRMCCVRASRSTAAAAPTRWNWQVAGTFNLAAPTVLKNIQDVTATEGQGSARPVIYLRDGTDLTLTWHRRRPTPSPPAR